MSSTTSSTAAAATCTGSPWELPVQDIACAITTNTDETSSIMDKCCADANVETYNDDCSIYCLAQGQSGQDLLDCLKDEGATDGQYFCSAAGANLTQTATAPVPTATGNDDGDDDEPSSTDDAEDPETTDNAAVTLGQPVNKAGLGVLAMLLVSAVMGVVA
ncbi:uncharacterized protein BDV17DRAFT_194725 [Aspergillus undulatus]|uniref:uncharacterized protein n=1 Tax=Aspergillus undulatus TaxID=1810928 RepID=UPI003CCE50EF